MTWDNRTLKYIDSLKIDETGFHLFRNSGESLYGCCFALMTKYYLNDFDRINKKNYADYLNSFQDEETGFYVGPETKKDELGSKHTWEHVLMHLTVHVLPTLLLLDSRPKLKFKFLEDFKDIRKLEIWLNQRDFRDAWYEGNYLLFIGQLLCYEMAQGDERAKKALEFWFDWLDGKSDPGTGLWGTDGKCDFYNAIYGAYHQFLVYYYLGRPIKFHEKVIDTTLMASNAIGSGACEDVDIIDILVNGYKILDYRRNDIETVLQKGTVDKIFLCQNEDGGFTYDRRNALFSMMGIKRTAYPMPNSHLFPTWFRVHTLALLHEIIDDPRLNEIDFRFNTFCSMGWHKKSRKNIMTNGDDNRIPDIITLAGFKNEIKSLPNTMVPIETMYRGEKVSLVRKVIMQFLEEWAPKIKGDVLDIGAGNWKYPRELFKHCNYLTSDITKEYFDVDIVLDVLNPEEKYFNKFNAIICTDLLEHVTNPFLAIENIYKLLKEDGLILLTTPFNYELHGTNIVSDYWRITGDGLKLLLERAGFRNITIDSFGNEKSPLSYCASARKSYGKDIEPVLFNQGAGNIGGPSVKLGRLNKYFKTDSRYFNIVYSVSNQVPIEVCRELQKQGKKIVYNCPGVLFPAYRPNYEELNKPLKELHYIADYVIYQSNFSQRGAEKFLGTRTKPGSVIYNGVDASLFTFVKRPPNRCNLLIAGNIYIRHRLEPIIRAFPKIKQEIPQAELFIAGPLTSLQGGAGNVFLSDFNEIVRICNEVGVQFQYLSEYTQEKAPSLYAEGDIFIHLKHLDWCPNVVLEAMSTGLPIVHAGNGGTNEIVGEGGIGMNLTEDWNEIPHFDLNKLYETVVQCFHMKMGLGEKARKIVENKFGISKWIEEHEAIFKEILL